MFFVAITGETAEQIAAHAVMRRFELGRGRGFGSVKVIVHIGESRWTTSVFPNGEEGWMLPVKAAIRLAEGMEEGDEVQGALGLL